MSEADLKFVQVPDVTIVRYHAFGPAPVGEIFDAALPQMGGSANTRFAEILWRGPSVWWLKSRTQKPADLMAAVGMPEFTLDLSDAFATFSIAGTDARMALSTGCPIDLHPSAFPPGSVAGTRCDEFEIVLHARGDGSFDLHVARSYARDARAWLEKAFAQHSN